MPKRGLQRCLLPARQGDRPRGVWPRATATAAPNQVEAFGLFERRRVEERA
jgi:hypothetical protein